MLRCQSSCSGHLWPPQNSPLSLVFDPACDTVRKQNKVTVRKNTCHTHTKEARRREGEKQTTKQAPVQQHTHARTGTAQQRNGRSTGCRTMQGRVSDCTRARWSMCPTHRHTGTMDATSRSFPSSLQTATLPDQTFAVHARPLAGLWRRRTRTFLRQRR